MPTDRSVSNRVHELFDISVLSNECTINLKKNITNWIILWCASSIMLWLSPYRTWPELVLLHERIKYLICSLISVVLLESGHATGRISPRWRETISNKQIIEERTRGGHQQIDKQTLILSSPLTRACTHANKF